jgi:hypothetical protein
VRNSEIYEEWQVQYGDNCISQKKAFEKWKNSNEEIIEII